MVSYNLRLQVNERSSTVVNEPRGSYKLIFLKYNRAAPNLNHFNFSNIDKVPFLPRVEVIFEFIFK